MRGFVAFIGLLTSRPDRPCLPVSPGETYKFNREPHVASTNKVANDKQVYPLSVDEGNRRREGDVSSVVSARCCWLLSCGAFVFFNVYAPMRHAATVPTKCHQDHE